MFLPFFVFSFFISLFYCPLHSCINDEEQKAPLQTAGARCLTPQRAAYLWREQQSETVTARWKPRLHWEPTSWTRLCSAPVDTSGTESGNTSAREREKKRWFSTQTLRMRWNLEDAPAERRERPLRSGRPGGRWGRGNAPLCAVGWRKPTSTDTWEIASASTDDPGSALQETMCAHAHQLGHKVRWQQQHSKNNCN